MINNIFSQKNLVKILAFFLLRLPLVLKIDHNIDFGGEKLFYSPKIGENRRKV
jgi:hypothetical protein